MSDKKVTWNDIEHGSAKELMGHYKLNERQMEIKLRKHLDGASNPELQSIYRKFYSSKK